MDLNKATLIGNVVKDPEVRQTPTGQTVATITVATNYSWTDQSGQKQTKAEFHNIIAWKHLADICGKYLKKGSKIYVEGRLQTRNWLGKDGLKRYTTEIIADNLIMLDRIGSQNNNTNYESSNNDTISYSDANNNSADEFAPSEDEIKVENIPF